MMTSVILIGLAGLSVPGCTGVASIAAKISSPPTSLPKTVCYVKNHWLEEFSEKNLGDAYLSV